MNNFQSNFEQFAININDIIPKQTRQEIFTVSIIPRRTNKKHGFKPTARTTNMSSNRRESFKSELFVLLFVVAWTTIYISCAYILKQEAGARRFNRAKRARRRQVDVGRLNSSTLAHEAQVAFLVHERLYLSVHVHPLGSFHSWPTYLRFLPLHGFHKSVD